MRHLNKIIASTAVAAASAAAAWAATPYCDFSFETPCGRTTTLGAEVAKLRPESGVTLVLFDPDCDDCHRLLDSLETVEQSAAVPRTVFVVMPVDEDFQRESDPAWPMFQRDAARYPAGWYFGIDNGSIFQTDACTWDVLPLRLDFRADEFRPDQTPVTPSQP